MKNQMDISENKYAKLTVIKFSHVDKKTRRTFWLCKCDCGNTKIVCGILLKNGNTRSCGCLRTYPKTHGMSGTTEHNIWRGITSRCKNRNNKDYHLYGGRGITVCDRWCDFENFLADMGKRPSKLFSIDRINNDGNYEPSNCRWATAKEQKANSRHHLCFIKSSNKGLIPCK